MTSGASWYVVFTRPNGEEVAAQHLKRQGFSTYLPRRLTMRRHARKQERVIRWLSGNLPEDAILANGAGNFAAFLHRYFTYKRWGTQLAPTSGSMGYGFPVHRGGPMFHAGRVGLKRVLRRMKEFATNPHADPPFWKPAKLITRLAAEGRNFDDAPAKRGASKRSRKRG